MPVGGGPSNGDFPSVAQLPIVFVQTTGVPLTFSGAGTLLSKEIHSDNLPGFNIWVLQISGAGAVSVIPQFANGQLGGLAGPDWQPLDAPLGPLVIGTPLLKNYRLGSRRHRLSLTSTGAAVVIYRITNSLT